MPQNDAHQSNHVIFAALLTLSVMAGVVAGCTSAPATPTAMSYASGGLGLTKAEWEQQHGPVLYTPGPQDQGADYEKQRYYVAFWHDWPQSASSPDSRVSRIKFNTHGKTPDEMRAAARILLPGDAQFQESGLVPGFQGTVAPH